MSPVTDIVTGILAVIMLLAGGVLRPKRLECPGTTWYLSRGVNSAGFFRCEPPPIGGDNDVLTGKSTAIDQPGMILGRVYCGMMRPLVIDYRTAGCSNRAGS